VLVVPAAQVEAALAELTAAGEAPWVLGELVAGRGVVSYR